MTLSFVRSACALTLLASLSACGGKAQYDVAGVISGLTYNGLELSNSGSAITPAGGTTSFVFPGQISYGSSYDVTVTKQPAHQTCAPVNGSGTAGHTAIISVGVSCALNSVALTGTVTGLTADMELTNGTTGGSLTVLAASATGGATTFTFGSSVAFGTTYGVTVLTHPTNFTCTVTNGTGTMGDTIPLPISVACVPNAAP